MNLRPAVLDALRSGIAPKVIADHFSITELDVLQIVANELAAKLPQHLIEYVRLQEMEKLWAEKSCNLTIPPPEAYSMLTAQRDRFQLAMEKEIRRASGLNSLGDIRGPVDAFLKALDLRQSWTSADTPQKSTKTRGAKRKRG
jgi:hypothetical protein